MKPYQYIYDDFAAAIALEDLAKYTTLGLDTETVGLDPLDWNSRLRLIQLASPICTYVFDVVRLGFEGLGFLRKFLERDDKTLIMHHAKFDLKFLRMFLGVKRVHKVIDTYLAALLTSCGLFELESGFGLDAVCHKFLGIRLDKDPQTSDWSVPELSPTQIKYAALDADIMLDLWPALAQKLVEQGQMLVAQIEFGAVQGIALQELNGLRLHRERWTNLCDEITQDWKAKRKEVQELLAYDPGKTRRAGNGQGSLFGAESRYVNLDSPPQLIAALEYHGIPVPLDDKTGRKTTGKHKMNALAIDYPIVNFLRQYRQLEKWRSSYGYFWLDLIHPVTGRLHMDVMQIGAKTGRMAVSRLHQVPAKPRFRRCFVADPGKRLVRADYSQFELRILADLAGDEGMIDAFQRNLDFHVFTAERTGVPRSVARNLNYAIPYGASPTRFALMCDPLITASEAMTIMDADRKAFPKKHAWLDMAAKDAVRFKQSVTRTGRVTKYLFDPADKKSAARTERNGKNSPIQGLNADVTKRAIYLIHNEIYADPDIHMVHVVHDEIVNEATPEAAPRAEEMLRDLMSQAAREFIKKVHIKVDTHIGEEWTK
jgi:DNA polymerase-1